MTVFKTTLKILNKCKVPIIFYTIILIFFAGFNTTTNDNNLNFSKTLPDVAIVNNDELSGLTKNLIEYFKNNSNVIDDISEDELNDALFYREVNYIIYIPKNFRINFLNKQNPQIEIKSTKDYNASLANILLERYLNVANTYLDFYDDENILIKKINDTLNQEVSIKLSSKLDTNTLNKVATYYNFTNYCFLAGSIYAICLVLSSFKNENIRKRSIISKMSYKKFESNLLISNSLFAFGLWIFYCCLSVILFGNIMFTLHGLYYILNSFIFSLCSLSIAFLLGNLIHDKNALNGIINVIALGSSFLCGAFVPIEMLPKSVLNIAHILPSYYFIKSNELIKTIEIFDFENLKPLFINMFFIILFTILFIFITNYVTKKQRKIA